MKLCELVSRAFGGEMHAERNVWTFRDNVFSVVGHIYKNYGWNAFSGKWKLNVHEILIGGSAFWWFHYRSTIHMFQGASSSGLPAISTCSTSLAIMELEFRSMNISGSSKFPMYLWNNFQSLFYQALKIWLITMLQHFCCRGARAALGSIPDLYYYPSLYVKSTYSGPVDFKGDWDVWSVPWKRIEVFDILMQSFHEKS